MCKTEIQPSSSNAVNISPVNPTKSLLIVNCESGVSQGLDDFSVSLSSDGSSIEVKNVSNYKDGISFQWQVIEFF